MIQVPHYYSLIGWNSGYQEWQLSNLKDGRFVSTIEGGRKIVARWQISWIPNQDVGFQQPRLEMDMACWQGWHWSGR